MRKTAKNLIGLTLLTGVTAGVLSLGFRLLLTVAEQLLERFLAWDCWRGWIMITAFAGGIILTYIISVLVKWNPSLSGGGIPHMICVYRLNHESCWWKNVIGNLAGCTLALLGGESVGHISPVIQLAASCGKGVAFFFHKSRSIARHLMLFGAAAGFTAAFSAPICGVLFPSTEVHKKWSWPIIALSLLAVVPAYLFSTFIFGFRPFFEYKIPVGNDWKVWLAVLAFALITAWCGMCYNYALMKIQYLYDGWSKHVPLFFRIGSGFFIAWLLAFYMPTLLGGGNYLLPMLFGDNPGAAVLLWILGIKFVFSLISPASGVPGGLMFPIMILGGLLGKFFAVGLVELNVLPEAYIASFVLFGMTGMFVATVRDPWIGMVLPLELTWMPDLLPAAVIMSMICWKLPDYCGSTPIYEALAKRIFQKDELQ